MLVGVCMSVFMSVCAFVCVYMDVRSPIPRYDFVKCEPIATNLDIEVAGYDICMVEIYHGNMSKVKVLTSKNTFYVTAYFLTS